LIGDSGTSLMQLCVNPSFLIGDPDNSLNAPRCVHT
jgi:hypothetical protein